MISVLVADDSEIMRKTIARLLGGDGEIRVMAEAATFSQTLQLMSVLQPQVVLMDLHMGDESSETPSQVKAALAASQLLAMSIWKDNETISLADRFGAAMLLDKSKLANDLIPAIKDLCRQ